MKTKKFLWLAMSVVALLLTSCSGDDEETSVDPTGISLDQVTLSVAVESSKTLVATLEPTGAKGTITWNSSAPNVASVVNGVVTGLSEGTATVVAACGTFTASCVVTVTKKPVDPSKYPSLQGSDYFLFVLDGASYETIKANLAADFRPDDVNKFLYVWSGTMEGGLSSGLSFYGESEGWTSLKVTNVGWSGAGLNIGKVGTTDMKRITDNPDDYYFHLALKGKDTSPLSYAFLLDAASGVSAKFSIGSTPFMDNGVALPVLGSFTRDGEWSEIEISMKDIIAKNPSFRYGNAVTDVNIFSFLVGGTEGATLDMDAAFIYKKKK